MNNAYNVFQSILLDTKNVDTLYTYLENVIRPPYDYSDLLRWQWAQSVSALDKFIHDVVRIGMIQEFCGNRTHTTKYLSFSLDLDNISQMNTNPLIASSILERQITIKMGFLSFQEPEKIADALSYIWPEPHKWRAISTKMGLPENNVKVELKNISIRRNQIVHEGDYSSILLHRQNIVHTDVVDVISFIDLLGTSIYQLIV